jgi:hypothetical protein
METGKTYTSFVRNNLLASGERDQVLTAMKSHFDREDNPLILTFEDQTGRQVDFDLRGTLADVLARAKPDQPRVGPGRPKLGVVAREVSLLPRHWEWLEEQPNGASAAIRRLVDEARKREPGERQVRAATEAAGRFLSAMAGNLPGYEEASRALYARNGERFGELIRDWPHDVQTHVQRLVDGVF